MRSDRVWRGEKKMIFTTRPLKVVHETSDKPLEDFRKHQLTKKEACSLTRKNFFIRVIGVEKDEHTFLQEIKAIDDYFLREAKDRNYIRREILGPDLSIEKTTTYLEIYETWFKLKEARAEEQFNISFPGKRHSDVLEWTKKCAFKEVMQIYEQYIPHANPSTTKNFAVKLLSLIDTYLPMLIEEGKPQPPKFLYIGPIKRQEFLFLYFLFLIGCDVLYINPVEDSLGDFEEVQFISKVHHYQTLLSKQPSLMPLTSYQKEVEQKQVVTLPAQIQSGTHQNLAQGPKEQRVTTVVPSRVELTRTNETVDRGRNKTSERELTYEELAQLSTSIVMITVLDGQGRAFKGGSGVVIHEEGYILTNFHVVRDGCSFEVQFENETQTYRTSRIVKYHPNYDLALIKVDKYVKPLPLYREDHLVRGQRVVAIGSPLGLFNTVSDGIISAFREFQDMSMIQFTAPISNGSSGGALLDMYGQLIGIITAGFDMGQNLNLAVKSQQIYYFANNFLPGDRSNK